MDRLRVVLWMLLVAWLATPSALAETRFDIEVGFSGRVVEGAFAPVRVHVEHTGVPVDGRLVLTQTVETPWHGVFTETRSQPLRLGQKASKTLTVQFPLSSAVYPLIVRLEDESGRLLAEHVADLRDVGQAELLVVALSETGFPSALPNGQTPLNVPAEQLPELASGFEALGRIYLGRFSLGALSQRQRQALWQWVQLGGDLVVLGGNNWFVQDDPDLRARLPLAPEGVTDVAYADGRTLPTLVGRLRGSVIFASLDNRPLVLRRSLGLGRVWLTTVDPLAQDMPAGFWSALEAAPFQNEVPFDTLAQETFMQQPLVFPSRLLIASILVTFVAGMALLSWLGLRRPWATGALLGWVALAGAVAMVVLNQPNFSRPLTAVELALESVPVEGPGYQRTWLGVYAQRREDVAVTFPAGAGVRQLLPANRGNHLFDLDLSLDGAVALSFKTRPQQVRALSAQATVAPTLRWRALSPEAIEVVASASLTRAWVLLEGVLLDLGPLKAQQPRRVVLAQLPRLDEDQLPSPVVQLWRWALDQGHGPALLGGWAPHGDTALRAPATHEAYHVVVAEVAL